MLHAVAHVVHQLGLAGEPFLTLGAPIPDITKGQHKENEIFSPNSPVFFLPFQRLDLLKRIRVNILGLFLLLVLSVVVTVSTTTPGAPGAVRPRR